MLSHSPVLTSNFDDLEEFRPSPPDPKTDTVLPKIDLTVVPTWAGDGKIVAFDQALANTGFVIFEIDIVDGLKIHAMDVIHTVSTGGRKSWEDNLYRSTEIFERVSLLLQDWRPALVLHETPPVGQSSKMHRTDSSVVAATAIQCACRLRKCPTGMVAAQKVKKHLTGDAQATKRQVREALELRFAVQLDNKSFRKNEHTFDSLGIGVTYIDKESS